MQLSIFRYWPVAPIDGDRIVISRVTAVRYRAERHPANSLITVHDTKPPFEIYVAMKKNITSRTQLLGCWAATTELDLAVT